MHLAQNNAEFYSDLNSYRSSNENLGEKVLSQSGAQIVIMV